MFERRILAALSGAAMVGLVGVAAQAATETVNVEVEFVEPIEISTNETMRFGLLDAGLMVNNFQLVLDTANGVLPAAPLLNADQSSANLTVTATAGTPINISVGNHTGASSYDLHTFTCAYDNEGVAPCSGAGLDIAGVEVVGSATLTIGATLEMTQNASVGTDDSTIDVTITYQ